MSIRNQSEYSEQLTRIEPQWKRQIAIPAKKDARTPRRLRAWIEILWRRLDRPFQVELLRWDVSRLFAEWFERTAELIMRDKYPTEHVHIRMQEERDGRVRPRARKRGKYGAA